MRQRERGHCVGVTFNNKNIKNTTSVSGRRTRDTREEYKHAHRHEITQAKAITNQKSVSDI